MNLAGLRWGVVGPGSIASVFAASLARSGAGSIARVFGRRAEKVAAFCEAHGGEPVPKPAHAWTPGDVDVLYVATPHAHHVDAVRPALLLGTPVLCEKPLTTDPRTTADLLELARETGTPLMEGWMYRNHPQFARLIEMVGAGLIGRPLGVEARLGFEHAFDPEHRLHDPDLGGGAILDVGGYPISLALAIGRLANQGAVTLREAHGALTPTEVDRHASATLVFEQGLEARVEVATDRLLPAAARIVGECGRITVHEPWMPEGRRDGLRTMLTVETEAETREVVLESEHDMFALEARAMGQLVVHRNTNARSVEPIPPLVTHEETLRIAQLMADWRAAIGAR